MFALSPYRVFVAVLLASATAASAQSPYCRSGPLPENPDNRIVLCSPEPAAVRVRILTEGLELAWDAPPRATTTYVSPVLATEWIGVDSLAEVSGMQLSGTYLNYRDRRIELSVLSIDSLGTGRGRLGVIGRDRIRIAWNSRYEGSVTSAVAGTFDLPVNYNGEPLRFDVPNRNNPTFPPDTTVVAGVRLRFRPGDEARREDSAFFDVEDWEGYHVWRWGGDPTSPNYEAVGEYSKLKGTASPDTVAWRGVRPSSTRILFLDKNVFDGFTYHYAITTYDQGFRRATSGQDLAVKFESPLELATTTPDGVVLGLTQIRVEFRRQPPDSFEPIAAVPNPFYDSAVDPAHGETTKVSFINAPPKGTLYIFTLAGDLVFQRDHDQPSVGTIDWDTKNQTSHEKVASGVYIYKIVDLVSGEQSYGRLAIIR